MSDRYLEPAECFPVGEYLGEELACRRASLPEVARACRIELERLVEILEDSASRLLPDEAVALATYLDVHPGLLLNLDREYHAWALAQKGDPA